MKRIFSKNGFCLFRWAILAAVLLVPAFAGCRGKPSEEVAEEPIPVPIPVVPGEDEPSEPARKADDADQEDTDEEKPAEEATPATPTDEATEPVMPEKHEPDIQKKPPVGTEPSPPEEGSTKPAETMESSPSAAPKDVPAPKTQPQEEEAVPIEPPAELHEPKVALSEEHQQTCLIGVGDAFPDLELVDLSGAKKSLASLAGEKVTVVVFWSTRQAMARYQFKTLEREWAGPFRAAGVQVVAVNVSDEADVAKTLYQETGGSFPCLLDPEGRQFAKVARSKLPRTYVLDGQRRVRWFDIEYSRSTRRELKNALFFLLKQNDQ